MKWGRVTSRTDLAPEQAGPRGALQMRPRLGQDERICPSSPQEKKTTESDRDMAGTLTLGGGTMLREKQSSDSVQAMLQTKQVLGATQQANRAGAGAS